MNTIMHLFSDTTLFMIEFLKGANIIYAGVVQGEMIVFAPKTQNSKLMMTTSEAYAQSTKR